MREVLIGQTDYTVLVKIVGTDGAPESGLTEASIDLAYSRVETDNDVTTADVTPAALSALTDAHTDWGFEEVSSTDHPGLYRLDIADAVFASGAWEAVVTITDASGTDFYAVDIGFRLVAFNPLDGVRLGLTALPNAAADAAGGLPISAAGGLDLDAKIGALTFTVANKVDANATHISGDSVAADNAEAFFDGTGYAGTNNVIPTVTTVTNLTNAPTAGDLTATMKTSVNTEVLDVLNTDTFAEPGQEAPGATVSLVKKIGYLYKAWRNKKTQTSSAYNLLADDATTVDQKATVSDDGTTTTIGEVASGP
jgi:hypothetical protein